LPVSKSGNGSDEERGDKPSAQRPEVRRIFRIEMNRSFGLRLTLAVALVVVSLLTNRSFLGWGLLVIFAVLFLPLRRMRSFIIAFIPYATVWFGFTALRSLADETTLARTVNTAVPNLERWIFGGQLPTTMLQDRFFDRNHLHWYDYFCTGIHWSYFLVPHTVAVLTWYKKPDLFKHYLSAMTLLLGVGLAIYFLIPTNPPWMAPEAIDSSSAPIVYRIMTNVAEHIGGGLYEAGYKVIGESNPRAAMPSIHMAITFLLVFPAFHFGRKWGYLALLYSACMGYSLMYLGEHYFVDVVAGMVVTSYGWYASGAWLNRVYPTARRFMPWASRVDQQSPVQTPSA
jgi:membrane-associated phospholipid phosphatase